MQHNNRWMLVILVIAGLLLAACTQASALKARDAPVKLESIEGSDFKRVVVTEKAAQRLDIQTAPVRDEQGTRKRTVVGIVAALPEPGSGDAVATYVRVPLNENDPNKVDRSQPALILPMSGGNRTAGVTARTVDRLAMDDPEEQKIPALYYEVEGAPQDLAPGQNVHVELTLVSNGAQHKAVPYAALIYGLHGETWVYTRPEPLVFIRHPVTVDYIDGDQAILSEGPPAGTEVVTVAGAELYGAETGVSK